MPSVGAPTPSSARSCPLVRAPVHGGHAQIDPEFSNTLARASLSAHDLPADESHPLLRLTPFVLRVLATERHESHRIERHLYGRAARQGDPGSAQAFMSLEDELIRRFVPKFVWHRLETAARRNHFATQRLAATAYQFAQTSAQHLAFRQRRNVLKFDTWLADSLSFVGSGGV